MSSLERIIERLKKQKDADRRLNHLEPKVDDRDLPKLDDGAQQR